MADNDADDATRRTRRRRAGPKARRPKRRHTATDGRDRRIRAGGTSAEKAEPGGRGGTTGSGRGRRVRQGDAPKARTPRGGRRVRRSRANSGTPGEPGKPGARACPPRARTGRRVPALGRRRRRGGLLLVAGGTVFVHVRAAPGQHPQGARRGAARPRPPRQAEQVDEHPAARLRLPGRGEQQYWSPDISGERSDTTILLHLSPNRDRAVAISFPRDSMVQVPQCEKKNGQKVPAFFGMINAAFAYAGPPARGRRSSRPPTSTSTTT